MQQLFLRIGRSYRATWTGNLPLKYHFLRGFATRGNQPDGSTSDKPTIRWYEQLYDGAPFKRQVKNEGGIVDEDAEETEELKRENAVLKDEIAELREGKNFIDPLLQQLSSADREKVLRALDEDAKQRKENAGDDEIDEQVNQTIRELFGELGPQVDKPGLRIHLNLLPHQQTHLKLLNACLQKAADDIDNPSIQQDLWRAYEGFKLNLPESLRSLSSKAWSVLWDSQSRTSSKLRKPLATLCVLAEDMLRNRVSMTPQQKMLSIESLFQNDRLDDAIRQWSIHEEQCMGDGAIRSDYQILGVRLYSSSGDLDRARAIAFESSDQYQSVDTRVFVTMIEAWNQKGNESSVQTAWALYLCLQSSSEPRIRSDDFDRISISFLKSGRSDLALAVFKDMMLAGDQCTIQSNEFYKISLGLIGKLQSQSTTLPEVIKTSMTALTVLPREFQNKYFYGSWMKKLIGLGESDAAAAVVELMYERGVRPDPKHLNGIIGSWLRSGSVKDKNKAEQLGWAMIHERIDFVRRRKGGNATIHADDGALDDPRIPPHLKRRVPSATIETFCLLLLSYERRKMMEHVQLLLEKLAVAEIQPNSYFMNHLLYAELRRGNYKSSWNIYQKMAQQVQPDLETFAALWDCQKAHQDRLTIYKTDHFPGPRRIMCEMMSWYSSLGKAAHLAARQEFSADLYEQIILCLGLSRDLEATVVALYALKDNFGVYPSDGSGRTILLQIARIGAGEPQTSKPRRRRLSSNAQGKANIARVTQILDLITEQRAKTLEQHKVVLEDCGDERQKDEHLYMLAELVRVVLGRMTGDVNKVARNIEKAAWEMGVGGVPMSDPLHAS